MKKMNRRQALKTGLAIAQGISIPFSARASQQKIALADENILNPFERPSVLSEDYYGDVNWNNLQTQEQRDDLISETLETDKTDEHPLIKDKYDCTQFASQFYINFRGYLNRLKDLQF